MNVLLIIILLAAVALLLWLLWLACKKLYNMFIAASTEIV